MLLSGNYSFPSQFSWASPASLLSGSKWDEKSWLTEPEKSSNLYKEEQNQKKGGIKRRRDGVDQVDMAMKKLRFTPSDELNSSSSNSNSSNLSMSSPNSNSGLSSCTALVPVTSRHVGWNRHQWEAKRAKPKSPFSVNVNMSNMNMSSMGSINAVNNINLRKLKKVLSVNIPFFSEPSNETALVLYRPPGQPNSYVEEPDDEESTKPTTEIETETSNSKTLYSSAGCTIELIEDDDDVSME